LKIGIVQYSPEWENKESNKNKISDLLSDLSDSIDLLVFPEMTLTGFSMQPKELAENLQGESVEFFLELATKNKCDVIAGIIEIDSGLFYNSLVHINPEGKLIAAYRKIHPFSYSDEDKYFSAGDKPIITMFNDWKIGLSICYDLRFPELYRFYANERVHLIIVIANWPDTRIEHWRTLLKARAIENQCYVIGVNRVGKDLKLNYNGFSSVFDPMGIEMAAVKDNEGVVIASINQMQVEETRTTLPFLEDIRLI
jgi:predicted amidohydrolase